MSFSSGYAAAADTLIYRPQPGPQPEANPSSILMLDRVKILVVDDESDERSLLKTLLELYGAHVITADSGLAGVRQFTVYQPQILISDISLLDFDGFELLRRIRAQELLQGLGAAASIPAIAISGYGGEERRMQALNAGFIDYITKPCNPGKLLAIMSMITRRKRQNFS